MMNTDNDWFYHKDSDPLEIELSEKQKRIIQLIAEVERLKKIEQRYEEYLQRPDCFDCGHVLTEVRPGKHQCDWCELLNEVEKYKQYYNVIDDALVCSHIGIASGNAKDDLNKLLSYEYGLGEYSGKQETANHCLEIVKKYIGRGYPKKGDDWSYCAKTIANEICEEFSLGE